MEKDSGTAMVRPMPDQYAQPTFIEWKITGVAAGKVRNKPLQMVGQRNKK